MSLVVEELVLQRADGVRLLGPLSLSLAPGERLGLAGESGSGKSLLARALFGVLPPGVVQAGGALSAFGSRLDQPGPARDAIRGARLAWVPQDPLGALNPLLTLGEHLALLPGIHRKETQAGALQRLGPLLERLRLPGEASFLGRFPHQLSGGQRQRLCLAMALSCDPELLVLDEPTTALDPLVQRDFLALVRELQRERGLGFLWITHDLAVASQVCERLLVLYGGAAMEAGPMVRLLTAPRHPYTARLLAAARRLPSSEAGFLPSPQDRPAGCPFQPRCERAQTDCAAWGPWQGPQADGLRCGHPLRVEAAPRP
ncbi:MAG: ABC transporter ATP-binding protein [Geothrix sp.]|jgi:oligopeptide/dipeptide ABC transporter ATP-binding protein|uniref:ABC transporter ATP-binding protein n=1 Tax=Candidatus Geothrix odensensis TaxID=2954440 RepID=A0A936K4Z9_9BACT|nr:ABC transporter ATP-binding protein [Candidatus Geothrix odensensis]MCC6514546.1 ABC transporter ATP-binding protein [Geothrix sp.]